MIDTDASGQPEGRWPGGACLLAASSVSYGMLVVVRCAVRGRQDARVVDHLRACSRDWEYDWVGNRTAGSAAQWTQMRTWIWRSESGNVFVAGTGGRIEDGIAAWV